jgi:hypothetical protein
MKLNQLIEDNENKQSGGEEEWIINQVVK